MSDQEFVIPLWLDSAFVETILRKKYGDGKAQKVSDVSVSVATKKGDHYSSEMFRVKATTSDSVQHSLILKQPHSDRSKSSIVEAYNFFGKEIKFYTEYLPALEEILRSVDEWEELAPELIYCDPTTQVIVMSDLGHEGFRTGDRTNRLCREAAMVFMRKLAKCHAASIVLNQRMSGALEEGIFDMFCLDGTFRGYFEQHPIALLE